MHNSKKITHRKDDSHKFQEHTKTNIQTNKKKGKRKAIGLFLNYAPEEHHN